MYKIMAGDTSQGHVYDYVAIFVTLKIRYTYISIPIPLRFGKG